MQINWENFILYNQDARGVRFKFEDLCRQLFTNENIIGNKQYRYLHANPNNAGLETEPILNEITNKRVGFQAKFFGGDANYRDIEDSASKTVAYYSGQVDIVYLFSNKPLTTSSLSKTKEILDAANIVLQLITDTAILDLIRQKYPYLGLYYFGNHFISHEWFLAHSNYMFDELGERYNRKFNVDTEFSLELSMFVHDQRAVTYINGKKVALLETIERLDKNGWVNKKTYLKTLERTVLSIPDVSIETLYDSFSWKEDIEFAVNSFLYSYCQERTSLQEQRKKIYEIVQNSKSKQEHENFLSKYQEVNAQIHELEKLIELPALLEITEREQHLIKRDILIVHGEAGIGKSQLLSHETKQLLDSNRDILLLVSGIYYTDEPIQYQIMKNLHQDYSIEELFDVLETIGEKDNRIVPVFIDALNETWNRKLWKTGLPQLIDKVKSCPMVKLVISYRTEYEKLLLSDSVLQMKRQNKVLTMHHRGFADNSIQAVREFLNQYNIPFTPLNYFGYEMTNPLFLTLYCKVYDGTDVSLPALYEKLLQNAGVNVFRFFEKELRLQGYTEDDDIIKPFVLELATTLVAQDKRSVTQKELCELKFWSHYQLAPAPFVKQLIQEHIIHDTVYNDEEHLYFAYDQMNDYYCAKAIIAAHNDKDELRQFLTEGVLGIHNNELKHSWNVDLFVNACALYAEKYGEECIDIIDILTDINDKWTVFSKYLNSFQWRDKRYIPGSKLYDYLKRYPCRPEDLWRMLIGNSIKLFHPLNADYLHKLLSSYELNKRDRLWTLFINKLTWDDSDRIVQLVELYNSSEKLDITDVRQVELLLTLFGWLLTSSNRWIRDFTSKAMIEILKEHFNLCKPVLQKFESVNDPYVIQRLYGIVFGACCKRNERVAEVFRELAEYVYSTIFKQDKVYPDILLRDYARLIVERFLYETPDYNGCIERSRIVPPYSSELIPEIEDQHYLEQNFNGCIARLMHSMRFEGMGLYGDFGRYVFQSSLHAFDVDQNVIFNYAVYYILNVLGYNEEYFGEYDGQCGSYDRNLTAKTERIGKKYQWVTMFNILARVSDHCKMIDRWSYPKKQEIPYEGAWEPYVRDFDPTLNRNFMTCPDAPYLSAIDEFIKKAKDENRQTDISDKKKCTAWLERKGVFFSNLKDTLLLKDEHGTEWVTLTKYIDTGHKELDEEKLLVWSWLYAYFVKPKQATSFRKAVKSGSSIVTGDTNSHHQTYSVFNREYPWAPSCKSFNEWAWIDVSLSIGEKRTNIGKILHATSSLLWEEEYDASKEEAISWDVPCAEVIETCELEQKKYDGFYYDKTGKLAAFDMEFAQGKGGVVIRKDLLEKFLSLTGMKLVWIVQGAKEIHNIDLSIARWSEWEALFVFGKRQITGEVCFFGHGR